MLPGMDGFEVLKRIRRERNTPVLMLTARGDEADQIVGLEIGADDYLPKGSSTRQLLARLHAITRRAAASQPKDAVGLEEIVRGRAAHQPRRAHRRARRQNRSCSRQASMPSCFLSCVRRAG